MVVQFGKSFNIGRLIEHLQTTSPNSELTGNLVPKLRQYAMTKFLRNQADTVVMHNGEKIITKGLDRKIISKNGTRYERVLQNNAIGNHPEQPWYVSCITGVNDLKGYIVELFNGKVKKIESLNGGFETPIMESEFIFDKSLGSNVKRENIPFKKLQEKIQKLFDKKCETAINQMTITTDEYSRLVKQAQSEIAYENGLEEVSELRKGLL